MDYKQGGWFRPTCSGRVPVQTVRKPIQPQSDPSEGQSCLTPTSLAMVLSPIQEWRLLYEPAKALTRGTLFAELDKPFTGKCC